MLLEVDTLLGVEVAEDSARLDAEDTFERDRRPLHDRDLEALLPRHCRYLRADPTCPDEDGPAAPLDSRADALGVLQVT